MRVFWWQAGIHLEPESKEEREAMALLYDGFRKTGLWDEKQHSERPSEAAESEQDMHRVVGNLEFHPSGIAPDLLNH